MERFKVIIVEDVQLELKGTEGILKNDIPEAEVIGTALNEAALWELMEEKHPDLILLDLGLGGSTTVGVDICRKLGREYPQVKVLIFTGEIQNERLWVEALEAGAVGIILKTGEMLTRRDVLDTMEGKQPVFNQPILQRITHRFREAVRENSRREEAVIDYEIDEYDERLLRHLALGYTKDMISNLKNMPFSSKSIEKRQNDLISRFFKPEERQGVNATRLVVRALELNVIDLNKLEPDEE